MLIPMMQLPGYSIADLICEDEAIAVYQGYAQSSGELVAIKLLKTKNPELKDVAQLKHEYNITEDLHITGIIKSRELISYHNGYSNQLALILEAFEGQFLKSLITATGLELTRFLHIAIQITEILGELHTRNLIHKDIQPQNILFHPALERSNSRTLAMLRSCRRRILKSLPPTYWRGHWRICHPNKLDG
jgi:serine/threonine protein kinase